MPSVERGSNGVGPNLAGLFERKAGALDDYRYSPALKRSGLTWTAKNLDDFVADPQKLVPATACPMRGMPNAGRTRGPHRLSAEGGEVAW